LRLALDAAAAGDRDEAARADLDVADAHDRVLGVRLARDELERLGDADRLLDAGHDLELARVERARVARRADRGPVAAGDDVGLVPHALDLLEDSLDLLLRGARFHDDEHL